MAGNAFNADCASCNNDRHSEARPAASSHCWRWTARIELAAMRMAAREQVRPVSRAAWTASSRARSASTWPVRSDVLPGLLEGRHPYRRVLRPAGGQRPHLDVALHLVALPLEQQGHVPGQGHDV